MATIVNTPNSDGSGSAGWLVAVVVLLLVILIGYFAWAHFGTTRSAPSSANINVTLPDTGGTSGGQGGGSGTGQ